MSEVDPAETGLPSAGDPWSTLLSQHPTMPHQTAHAIRASFDSADWQQLLAPFVEVENTTVPGTATSGKACVRQLTAT